MTEQRCVLLLHAYAPPLTDEDRRPLVIVEAMEHGMPGLRLGWTISDQGEFIAAPEGSARNVQRTRDGGFALYCNGNNDSLIIVSGWESPANLCPGRQAQLVVYAKWPADSATNEAASDVLERVSVGALSYWAELTPDSAALEIDGQSLPGPRGAPNPRRGLPVLKRPEELRSSVIPSYLGWLNYWSPATAQAIGFPDPKRDAELLARSRRTEAGGWVVRLTDAPLDLDNPAHLQALLRAYERFPRIGGRAP